MRRKTSKIFYYRTKSGKEVDFIITRGKNKKQLIQVCETLIDEKTKKREVAALIEAMKTLKLKSSFIITRNESDTIKTDTAEIHVVPVWKFMLTFE